MALFLFIVLFVKHQFSFAHSIMNRKRNRKSTFKLLWPRCYHFRKNPISWHQAINHWLFQNGLHGLLIENWTLGPSLGFKRDHITNSLVSWLFSQLSQHKILNSQRNFLYASTWNSQLGSWPNLLANGCRAQLVVAFLLLDTTLVGIYLNVTLGQEGRLKEQADHQLFDQYTACYLVAWYTNFPSTQKQKHILQHHRLLWGKSDGAGVFLVWLGNESETMETVMTLMRSTTE